MERSRNWRRPSKGQKEMFAVYSRDWKQNNKEEARPKSGYNEQNTLTSAN